TADDVKFSFERYRGAAAKLLKDKVAAVEVVDPYRVRFRLKEPWSDFMTFYGSPASGAAWIVPKKYVEKVGDDGVEKAPAGAGPRRRVQAHVLQPGNRDRAGGSRALLAQNSCDQAARLEERARGPDAPGHAQTRRGRRRVFAARNARGRGEEDAGAQARWPGR